MSATKDLFYTDDDNFSYDKEHLNIAVAFTAYNNNEEYELPKEYGELIFNTYSWGTKEDGSAFTERKRLPHHNCSTKELGLGEEGADDKEARFFPVHDSSKWFVNTYQKKFLCLNTEDLYIYGDFNTGKTRQLNIQLKKCQGVGCKTDAEITAFFMNKFILLHANQVRFDS